MNMSSHILQIQQTNWIKHQLRMKWEDKNNRTKQYESLRFSLVIQAWNRNASTLNPNKIDRSEMETSSGISWEISSGVLEYVRKHMMTYDVLQSNIKRKILSENLVPNNLKYTPCIDTYIRKGAFNRKLKVVYIEPWGCPQIFSWTIV